MRAWRFWAIVCGSREYGGTYFERRMVFAFWVLGFVRVRVRLRRFILLVGDVVRVIY